MTGCFQCTESGCKRWVCNGKSIQRLLFKCMRIQQSRYLWTLLNGLKKLLNSSGEVTNSILEN